jgi:hypothetical protein
MADAGAQQLRSADDALLLTRYRANCVGSGSVCGLNSTRFGHIAIVRAPAVPEQHACVTTLRPEAR